VRAGPEFQHSALARGAFGRLAMNQFIQRSINTRVVFFLALFCLPAFVHAGCADTEIENALSRQGLTLTNQDRLKVTKSIRKMRDEFVRRATKNIINGRDRSTATKEVALEMLKEIKSLDKAGWTDFQHMAIGSIARCLADEGGF